MMWLLAAVAAVVCLAGGAAGFEHESMYQYLIDHPEDFSDLIGYVNKAGLQGELSRHGALTFFAPTNAAFANMSTEERKKFDDSTAHMIGILHYHMVHGFILTTTVVFHEERMTIEGQTINLTQTDTGGLVINFGASMVEGSHEDIITNNGVVQPIDHVLFPHMVAEGLEINFGASMVEGAHKDIITNNGVVQPINHVLFPHMVAEVTIAEYLLKHDDKYQNFFMSLLLASKDMMLESGEYTVFAPQDSAFAEHTNDLLNPNGPNLLATYRAVMDYHMVPGARRLNMLHDGETLYTMAGLPLAVTMGISGVMINNSTIIESDIRATNGYIHGIDQVLIPGNIKQIQQG